MTTSSFNLLKSLDLKFPLIVAPMAGGPSSVELVVASSEAGALGSIGGAYMSAAALEEFILKVQAQTCRAMAVNLFIPSAPVEASHLDVDRAIEGTRKFREQFHLPIPTLTPPFEEDFDAQFEVVLRTRPQVLSFVFGSLASHYMKELKKQKICIIGTATSAEEARILLESDVDVIVAQGFEAGGHRGIFDAQADDPEIKTLDLVKAIKGFCTKPLIAAGGLMNAHDIQAALSAGATAVQMGTAFLTVQEAGTAKPYRERLLLSSERETKTTRAFSGRLARGVPNDFMKELDQKSECILPFPAQNKFTRDIRKASAENNSAQAMSLWAGSGAGELWTGSTAELIRNLFAVPRG